MIEETDIETEIDEEPELVLLSRQEFLKSIREDSNPLEDIRWVFQALGAEVEEGDAPNPGAWNLLRTLRNDDLALKSFYTQVYPKLLPTKAQMEKGDERGKDDQEHLDLVEELLREPVDNAPVLSGAERRARELAVSTTGS